MTCEQDGCANEGTPRPGNNGAVLCDGCVLALSVHAAAMAETLRQIREGRAPLPAPRRTEEAA